MSELNPMLAARAANLAIDCCTEADKWSGLCVQRMMLTGQLLGQDSGWHPMFGGVMIEAKDGGNPFGSDPECVVMEDGRSGLHSWLGRHLDGGARGEMLDPSAGYFARFALELGIEPLHPLPEGPFYWIGKREDAVGNKLYPGIMWRALELELKKLPPVKPLREWLREPYMYARALLNGTRIVTPNGEFSMPERMN